MDLAHQQSHREELDRLKRDLSFANERAEDSSRNKSSEVSGVMAKYNRQLTELEDSLRVRLTPLTQQLMIVQTNAD